MRITPLMLVLVASALALPHPAAAQVQTTVTTQPQAPPPDRPSVRTPTTSPFLGSVPSGTPTPDAIPLSITDAIARALQHNLGALTAEETMGHAGGTRRVSLSQLLPNVSGRVSGTRQELNLAAFGFPLPPGVPSVVGPFNVIDARIYVSQAVLDFRAMNEVRQEDHNVAAAQHSYRSARDLVVLVTANMYLQSLAASARVASVSAQLQTAQAIAQQAADLKQSGLVAGIDVLRADVQLSTQRQRATAATNDFEKSKLQLAHVIGLPIGQTFTLSDQLPAIPPPDLTLQQALDRAYEGRPDYLAAQERVRAAEAARRAALDENLPSIHVNADFGEIGQTIPSAQSTFAVVGAVNVPIFQGGRTRGHLLQADTDLRTRQAEAEDLRASIYYDVRSAFLDVQATGEQLDVAMRAQDLANQQLTQARDRFAAGVATNIEVVQAQESVAVASEQYINALYGFNVAKTVLAHGLGVAEQSVREFLGGNR